MIKAVHIDAKTGAEIEAHVSSGLVGFISWRRLFEVLRRCGELKPNEELLSFQIDGRGITFRVREWPR